MARPFRRPSYLAMVSVEDLFPDSNTHISGHTCISEPKSTPTYSAHNSDVKLQEGDSSEEDGAEAELDTRCGLGSRKPSWLQACNNPRAVCAWLCWFAFVQGKAMYDKVRLCMRHDILLL